MNLVQGRECGGCVACCKTLEIQDPQIAKPADTLCKHCTGHGCGIYDTRPPVCRDWYCLWRRDQNLPDQLRPDQCGVIFSIDGEDQPRTIFESFFVVGRSLENDRSVFDAPAVNAALQAFAQYGTPVFLSWELGTKGLLYPNGPLADAIERPSDHAIRHRRRSSPGLARAIRRIAAQRGHSPEFSGLTLHHRSKGYVPARKRPQASLRPFAVRTSASRPAITSDDSTGGRKRMRGE